MCKSVHYLDVKLVVPGVPRCIVFQFDPSSILRVIYEYPISKVTRAYPLLVWRVTLGLPNSCEVGATGTVGTPI